jgi:hypothetical protein
MSSDDTYIVLLNLEEIAKSSPYATEEDLDYTWMVDQARFSDKCIAVKKTSLAGSAHKEVSDRW